MAARITGRLGSVWIEVSGALVKVADVYDWTYEESLTTFNCTIKGEAFSRFRPGQNAARVTARRYVQAVANAAIFTTQVEYAIATGLPLQFTLYGVDGSTAFAYISGQGYVTRGTLSAPHEKMTDELEITVDGIPSHVG